MVQAIPAIVMAAGGGYSAYSAHKNKPKRPDRINQPASPVTDQDTQGAKDDVLRRMAKLRAANTAREGALTAPNVKRKVLGAGV